jgi:uncharacterized lipoprotein
MKVQALPALVLIGLLAACGTRAELRPVKGMTSVPKSAEAKKPQTPRELMTPSTQAKPDRRADLLLKSEERKADPFDLPPGPNNGRNGNED